MGILDLLRRPQVTVRISSPSVEAVMGQTPAELYERQPALRAVVSFLADNVAQLPIHCYVREADNVRRRDTESPLARLVRVPGGSKTMFEIVRDTMTDYLLYEWAAWVVLPSADTPSGWSITHIPTSWFWDFETVSGLAPTAYMFTNPVTGKRLRVPAECVVRFAGYGAKGPLDPSSKITALKQMLSEQISAWNYRNSIWKNGGRIGAYLYRPPGSPWSPEARGRFAASWKAKFSGEDGDDTGGTPLLEDGMELRSATFNAREAQWLETAKLTREDVAGVYHVNPSLIWHTDGQTYASAKDNARSLYTDTLGPFLEMLQQRINNYLLPMIGADPLSYVEFSLDAKLKGSFEERAGIYQTACGAPYMTREEVRAEMNLPPIEGAGELIVPLNVLQGGLASPTDTDGTVERYAAPPLPAKAAEKPPRKSRGTADGADVGAMEECLRKFLRRQAKSVSNAIEGAKGAKAEGDYPPWWNAERWNRELADDLEPLFVAAASRQGRKTLRDIGEDEDGYSDDVTRGYLRAMAEGKARAMNNVTLRRLTAAVEGDGSGEGELSTVSGVFENAVEERSKSSAVSFATAVCGWAALEAVRQANPKGEKLKTWIVTSASPRASHARMSGETVPADRPFSNGAMWPGDQRLTPEDSCNCKCEVEITIR